MGQTSGNTATAEISANLLPTRFLRYIAIAVAQKSDAKTNTMPRIKTASGIFSLCLRFCDDPRRSEYSEGEERPDRRMENDKSFVVVLR